MELDNYLVIDLETENNPYYGMVASPFCPDNYIVAVGYTADRTKEEADSIYVYENHRFDFLKRLLDQHPNTKLIIAHNATYELHWLMHDCYDTLLDYFKRGGKIWCTQYAEYLLTRQQNMYPALNEVAPKYGGTEKVDEVKLLWEQGVLTSAIDKDLLLEYLCSDHGDIKNTEKVFFGQLEEAARRNMCSMLEVRMNALVFNAYCTFNGMHIDMEVANKNLKEQNEEADQLRAKIKTYLPELPFEFNMSSRYHVSAWLYGGPIPYKVKVPYDPPKYVKADFYKDSAGNRYTSPDGVSDLQYYKSGKNKGNLKVFREDTTEERLKWGEKIYFFKPHVDLHSLPSEIKRKFLNKNGEFQGKNQLQDGTPVYSTSEDALMSIQDKAPIVQELLKLVALEKDIGTYYLKEEYDDAGNVKKRKGMLQYVLPNNIVHHQLNNCASVTGRLSSSRPNLQNLPRGDTSRVKQMFNSRFENGYCIEVDYSALEVVALAAISSDKNLIDALERGTDMHCFRLAFDQHLDYDYVYERCHNEDHPDHKEWKTLRTKIKSKSFAAQYGASANGIAFATGCTVEEAQRFLDNEDTLFPESRAFQKKVRKMVEITGMEPGTLEREFNPKTNSLQLIRRGYYKALGGTEYSFKQSPQFKDGQNILDYKDTEIANYPIQGEAAFIVQAACALVINWLITNKFFGGKVLPINTVHDAIYLDCATEELAISAGKKVSAIMAEAPKQLVNKIPAYKEWNYLEVPFPSEAEYGHNLYEKKGIK